MPELPEVETIAKQLDSKLEGKEIAKIEVLRSKSFIGDNSQLVGQTIKEVDRVAKMIVFYFKNTDLVMLGHLKMTGQLIWRPSQWNVKKDLKQEIVGGHPTIDWVKELPNKHTRVIIEFTDGSHLFFNDLRVFGWLKITSQKEIEKMLSKLPPDVVDKGFTLDYFTKVLKKSKRSIKLVILDQGLMGGVGNIYANDALFEAKINPRRPATSLTESEIKRLYLAIKKVIDLGIMYGGASAANFVHTTGLGGKYQEHFLVYKRDGEKCLQCKGTIHKISLGGRGTFFCPSCQK